MVNITHRLVTPNQARICACIIIEAETEMLDLFAEIVIMKIHLKILFLTHENEHLRFDILYEISRYFV